MSFLFCSGKVPLQDSRPFSLTMEREEVVEKWSRTGDGGERLEGGNDPPARSGWRDRGCEVAESSERLLNFLSRL